MPCSPALAFLHLWPPSPLATIHGSFASPGTQQCHKTGINAPFICPQPVAAPLAVPGAARQHTAPAQSSATQQLSSVGVRAIVRCPPARLLAVLGSSELRSSELSSAVRAPRGCQGSSSVSAGASKATAQQQGLFRPFNAGPSTSRGWGQIHAVHAQRAQVLHVAAP